MPQTYRVGLYIHVSDPQLAANQRAALRLYAENMGWTITIETTRIVISADGKTLTATQSGTNAQGQAVKNVIVAERQ